MSSLPSNLRSAVEAYREQVLNDNVAIMSYIISKLEDQPSEGATDTETQAAILHTLTTDYLCGDLPSSPTISTARELLEARNRPLLAEHFQLDGITRGNIDVEARQHWLSLIRDELGRLREASGRADGEWPDDLPSELQSLITNVHGITRPGLPCYHVGDGTDFFHHLIEFASTTTEKWQYTQNIFIPETDGNLDMIWPGWDIAVAVSLESGDQGDTMLALFCKDTMSASGEWAWRYGISEEVPDGSELFDDIESFLKWFATYRVKSGEDIERDGIFIRWGGYPRGNPMRGGARIG